MKALLVIDVQNVIVDFINFQQERNRIENIIQDIKENEEPVILKLYKLFIILIGELVNKMSLGRYFQAHFYFPIKLLIFIIGKFM